jgi:tRNA (Thr-GGU) A37 N-methylase
MATKSKNDPAVVDAYLATLPILEIAGNRLKLGPIEAIEGTPVVDIKPVLP